MKIVIDIDENVFTRLFDNGVDTSSEDRKVIDRAVRNGIVLPKGHGRLIDADDLIQDIIDDNQLCLFNSESERIVHDEMVNFAVDRLADCSTIIEADK